MFRKILKLHEHESASGVILFFAALIAFFLSNSIWSKDYFHFIHAEVNFDFLGNAISTTLHHIVNDGLMTIFFYVVGLEIKKELLRGDLSNPKKSSFAIFAALGGMVFPALIYAFFNYGLDGQHGWGIPMATDIAFAVGVIILLGRSVPTELKIFLLALAIVDDLGAVLVIAFFYTKELFPQYLLYALIPISVIQILNKKRPQHFIVYTLLGLLTWFFVFKSGVHATISGVILAFLTPFDIHSNAGPKKPLEFWQYKLHPWVNFLIMPLFAFFNSGLSFEGLVFNETFQHPVAQGVFWGLLIGKPVGIFLFCKGTSILKISEIPKGVSWAQIFGVGLLGGIGFTMALFVSGLSFKTDEFESYSKLGIMLGSMTAGILGFTILWLLGSKSKSA